MGCKRESRFTDAAGRESRRRGVVLPFFVISLFMFMAFAALAIDIGYMCVVKSELQRSADNGALGGAMKFADVNTALGTDSIYEKLEDVRLQAKHYIERNPAGGKKITVDTSKIVLGYLSDPYNPAIPIDTAADPGTFNAIQVTTRRTADSPNGSVGLFFATVLGKYTADLTATAVAVLDDHFAGIKVPVNQNGPVIPFAVYAPDWFDQVVDGNGPDNYGVDDDENVFDFGDGVPEIKLYADKLGPTNDNVEAPEDNTGSGNFGVLNIGVETNGTSIVTDQITDGITGQQLIDEFGTNELIVYPDSGGKMNMPVYGNPGLAAAVEKPLELIKGQLVGFFLYENLIEGTGGNTIFNVVGIQFGRVVDVNLTGQEKAVYVQPEEYYGPNIITDPSAPSTNGLIAKLSLVR